MKRDKMIELNGDITILINCKQAMKIQRKSHMADMSALANTQHIHSYTHTIRHSLTQVAIH